jgi:hypothetical protein
MSYVRVYSVSDLQVVHSNSSPGHLTIAAIGQVNSSGWSDGQLTEWVYVSPPTDRILDLDFVAKKPNGIVFWAFQPIHADYSRTFINIAEFWGPGLPLAGVRVHAASNTMDAPLSSPSSPSLFGPGDRWPW